MKKYPVALKDKVALAELTRSMGIEYLSVASLRKFEHKLSLAPIAALGRHERVLGVIASEDLTIVEGEDVIIGEYVGDAINLSDLVEGYDSSFVFELSNETTAIDARVKRGWPAFVNTSLSVVNANVAVKEIDGRLYYYLKRSIKAGEQILIDYGEEYNALFRTQLADKMRFLRSSDTHLDSKDIISRYRDYYDALPVILEAPFLSHFELAPEQGFMMPNVDAILGSDEHVSCDLPLLACQRNKKVFDQFAQENITLLMVACWRGQLSLIQRLLDAGANPNIQSHISGISACHLIVASPNSVATKKAMLNLLLRYQGVLALQDKNDLSVLHWAIRQDNVSMVRFFLELCEQNGDEHRQLIDCINHEGQDALIYAMDLGKDQLIPLLLIWVKAEDIQNYLDDDSTRAVLMDYQRRHPSYEFIRRLKVIINHDSEYRAKLSLKDTLDECLLPLIPEASRSIPKVCRGASILPSFEGYYHPSFVTLDEGFADAFMIDRNAEWVLPDSSAMAGDVLMSVDLPLLMRSKTKKSLLPNEEITMLMLACWQGDVDTVSLLLEHGADPNHQSSRMKISVMQLVLLSSQPVSIKFNLFSLLFDRCADFNLQDYQERTLFHHAVLKQNDETLRMLLKFYDEFGDDDSQHALDYVDDHDRDPFILAMACGRPVAVNMLVKLVRANDIKFYLSRPDIMKVVTHFFNSFDAPSILDAFKKIISKECRSSIKAALLTSLSTLEVEFKARKMQAEQKILASTHHDSRPNKRMRFFTVGDDYVYTGPVISGIQP